MNIETYLVQMYFHRIKILKSQQAKLFTVGCNNSVDPQVSSSPWVLSQASFPYVAELKQKQHHMMSICLLGAITDHSPADGGTSTQTLVSMPLKKG